MNLQRAASKRLGFRDPRIPEPKEKKTEFKKFVRPNKTPNRELYEKKAKNPGKSTVESTFRPVAGSGRWKKNVRQSRSGSW